ncbi:protein takeout-like [Atheta coriaria]|uniref:protein takeout-like n=1 Tax=Dalotia coriaria TaxID=877792 RepID=UPI0031F33A0B
MEGSLRVHIRLPSITCVVIALCALSQTVSAYLTEQPDYVKTCNINEPNFINCSTHAVQLLFNELPRGVPEIGLEPLDPLRVKRIKILQGAGPVNVNASLSNVTVVGFAHTKIVENRVDPVTYDFHTDLRLPRLRIDGRYVLLGRILVIPLRGIGQCWFDARNLEISAKSKVKMIKRGEFHFFSVQGITVKFQIGGLRLHLGNLFDGIKALEETTNAYLNENWRLVADSLNPILAKTIEDIMLDILKKVFDNVPADFLLMVSKKNLLKNSSLHDNLE